MEEEEIADGDTIKFLAQCAARFGVKTYDEAKDFAKGIEKWAKQKNAPRAFRASNANIRKVALAQAEAIDGGNQETAAQLKKEREARAIQKAEDDKRNNPNDLNIISLLIEKKAAEMSDKLICFTPKGRSEMWCDFWADAVVAVGMAVGTTGVGIAIKTMKAAQAVKGVVDVAKMTRLEKLAMEASALIAKAKASDTGKMVSTAAGHVENFKGKRVGKITEKSVESGKGANEVFDKTLK